jgi:hypothetical protein
LKNGLWDVELKSVRGSRRGIGGIGSVDLGAGSEVGVGAFTGDGLVFGPLTGGVGFAPLTELVGFAPFTGVVGFVPLKKALAFIPLKVEVVFVPPTGDEAVFVPVPVAAPPKLEPLTPEFNLRKAALSAASRGVDALCPSVEEENEGSAVDVAVGSVGADGCSDGVVGALAVGGCCGSCGCG